VTLKGRTREQPHCITIPFSRRHFRSTPNSASLATASGRCLIGADAAGLKAVADGLKAAGVGGDRVEDAGVGAGVGVNAPVVNTRKLDTRIEECGAIATPSRHARTVQQWPINEFAIALAAAHQYSHAESRNVAICWIFSLKYLAFLRLHSAQLGAYDAVKTRDW